jgi:hypothetical protein
LPAAVQAVQATAQQQGQAAGRGAARQQQRVHPLGLLATGSASSSTTTTMRRRREMGMVLSMQAGVGRVVVMTSTTRPAAWVSVAPGVRQRLRRGGRRLRQLLVRRAVVEVVVVVVRGSGMAWRMSRGAAEGVHEQWHQAKGV